MIRLRAEWVVPVSGAPIADGTVVVDGRHIVAVGPSGAIADVYEGVPERDLGAVALTPGFVDAHCHVEWSLSPHAGPCTDGFAAWLERILRRGSAMQPNDFLVSARSGVASALCAGTTLILDAGPTGAGAPAADELGLRAHVHLEAFGRVSDEEAAAQVAQFAPRVCALDADRVRGGVSPHAPYTVDPALWRALADHPDLRHRPWMTHVAESEQERAAIAGDGGPLTAFFDTRGSRPGIWPGTGSVIARLAANGALRPAWWPRTASCSTTATASCFVHTVSALRTARCPTRISGSVHTIWQRPAARAWPSASAPTAPRPPGAMTFGRSPRQVRMTTRTPVCGLPRWAAHRLPVGHMSSGHLRRDDLRTSSRLPSHRAHAIPSPP